MRSLEKPRSLLPFSRSGVLVLGLCGLLFLLCVALRINGSSSSFWYFKLGELDEAKGLIAGSPKPTRSDEWMVWTPAILSQLNHRPPLPVTNPSLGAGAAPLLMSIPVRHYSMLFRPQLWGFFFLDAEHGFRVVLERQNLWITRFVFPTLPCADTRLGGAGDPRHRRGQLFQLHSMVVLQSGDAAGDVDVRGRSHCSRA